MRLSPSLVAVAAATALACATTRPAPAPPPIAIAPTSAPGPARPAVSRGMEAAQVRLALGDPPRVEKIASAAAAGAAYERWIYADREVVLLDGKVVDVVP